MVLFQLSYIPSIEICMVASFHGASTIFFTLQKIRIKIFLESPAKFFKQEKILRAFLARRLISWGRNWGELYL
ncbi:MAG: hypothetical protein DBX55_02250 [Verrucomicrobia bacterium]|nr:MAG: hypothetical protein DBX55_02250 [Verrucomicrobiota bacterium]